MSERATVKKIQAGDPEAMRRLVAEIYPPVLRFLQLLTRSEEDAVDLAQQTFVKVRENVGRFRSDSRLRTWIMQIAYHEFTHWNRTRSHEPVGLTHEPSFELNEDGIVLAAAIGDLPDLYREAFVLREVDRLSIAEVATVLGVPVGTVKSRCSEARAILVRKLSSTFAPSNSKVCEAENGK